MRLQLDQIIITEINQILNRAQLNTEMLDIIKSSLIADSSTGEFFRWAHLTLLSCECVNGISEAALPGAIGMELFALAADIFDDVQDQDNDDLPWRKLSDANAINLAICLLMLSFEAVSNIADNRLFREISTILHRTGIKASNGQFRECLYDDRQHITLEQYFEMIKQKSGSLTANACRIGATLGGAPPEVISQVEQFGTNFGIMSQISNDLNDFLDFNRKKDFVKNKKTLPYVYLLNILQGESAERFGKLTQIEDNEKNKLGNIEQEFLKRITIDEGVVQYCKVMYEIFRQKAMDIIMAIPVPEKRKEKMIKLVGESV
jgi:competence protein ComQ